MLRQPVGIRSAIPALRLSVLKRSGLLASQTRFISQSDKKLSLSTSLEQPTTPPSNTPKTQSQTYLDTLTNSELLGYGVIGMATLTKSILDLVITLFPYTPMWLIKLLVYKNYCGGDDLKQVLQTGERLSERGIKNMMLSLTIEACDGNKLSVSIDHIVKETQKSISEILAPHTAKMVASAENINEIPPGYVALKPTGLVEDAAEVLLNYKKPEYKEQYNVLLKNCKDICQVVLNENQRLQKEYPTRIAPFVVAVIDAERNDLQKGVYQLQRDLFEIFNRGQVSVVGTVQMYLKESSPVLKLEDELARKGNYQLGWKLVRGAYIHSEPDRGVIHDTKEDTDINFDSGITRSIENMSSANPTIGHLVVASHNGPSQFKVTEMLSQLDNEKVKSNVVLGQLLGMADNITFELMNKYKVKNVIKYVPWGPPLETKEYLLRRLEENGDAVRSDSGWPLVKDITKTLFGRIF